MATPNDKTRDFGGADADMLEAARVTHGHFVEDYDEMIAFDETLEDPFADNFLAAIDAAQLLTVDNVVIDQQAEKTQTVEDAMKKGRNGFQALKYFIELAFPNNQAKWNQFGYNDYEEQSRSQAKFIQFLYMVHQRAVENQAALNAVGCTNVRIAGIKTLADNIQVFNLDQELFIDDRPVGTETRILALNSIWATVRRIRRAGKIIWGEADNFGKYQRYLGESAPSSGNPLTGNVPASSVIKILSGGFTATTAYKLENTGGTSLRFGLCQTDTEVPAETGITLAAGTEQNITVAMLGEFDETHIFINVLNLSSEAAGSYKVTLLE
ncbi:MAG: hypothetical protein IPM47_16590 [Sphingobacteriales bacterium]|nr:MAG: hypothetical protein IPM47_16590 [Sphingobacteriales bacterium]